MPNRSKLDIPAIYEPFPENWKENVSNCKLPTNLITYLHFHDITELGICLSGSGACIVENTEFQYKAGDVQIIFPYQKHYHRSNFNDNCIWYWNNVSTEHILQYIGINDFSSLNEHLRYDISTFGILDCNQYPNTCHAIRCFLENSMKKNTLNPLLFERMAFEYYNILLTLFEESQSYEKILIYADENKFYKIAPALSRIKDAISGTNDVSIEELADLCYCSTSNFRKLFHAAIGSSPKDYLTACRIRKAKNQLLHTTDSIISIAMSVGYHDISGFNRAFLKYTGLTPSEYRKSR